jgi:hypothetical protein
VRGAVERWRVGRGSVDGRRARGSGKNARVRLVAARLDVTAAPAQPRVYEARVAACEDQGQAERGVRGGGLSGECAHADVVVVRWTTNDAPSNHSVQVAGMTGVWARVAVNSSNATSWRMPARRAPPSRARRTRLNGARGSADESGEAGEWSVGNEVAGVRAIA